VSYKIKLPSEPSPVAGSGVEPACLVAAFYKFVAIDDTTALRDDLRKFCAARPIKGTILVAHEGINATVSGVESDVRALIEILNADPRFSNLAVKFSVAGSHPFRRLKVKIKREIVTLGLEETRLSAPTAHAVEPEDWNALISDPDVLVVDTRNDYEVEVGTFEGACNPRTRAFREFPDFVARQLVDNRQKKIAMFCTGGIRCEKATAYVKSLGIEEVFHLKGGILKYLEEVPEAESRWRGECFVFDERVSVGHGLLEGEAELCRACRRPLMAADRQSPHYRPGISCVYCHEERSEEDRARYAERHRQVGLAGKRGAKPHIGG